MQVFISWSGERSRGLAAQLQEWLQFIMPDVETWTSIRDIRKGTFWRDRLLEVLKTNHVAIVCCTYESIDSAWLLYEAGASRGDNTCTLLFDMQPGDIQINPLSMYQHTIATDKDDMKALLRLLNEKRARPEENSAIDRKVDMNWESFITPIRKILDDNNFDKMTYLLGYKRAYQKVFFEISAQYGDFIQKIVTDSKEYNTYYVSAGNADWTSAFLLRDFKDNPKINRVVIRHMDPNLVKKYEELGIMAAGYCNRMLVNLDAIRDNNNDFKKWGEIIIRPWNTSKFPPFHGHVYGDWMLIGKWAVNRNGFIGVETPLEVLHKSENELQYKEIINAFES